MRAAAAVSSPAPPCDPPPAPRVVAADHPFAAFAAVFAERVAALVVESRERSADAFFRERLGRDATAFEKADLLDDDDALDDIEERRNADRERDIRAAMPVIAPGLDFLGIGSTRLAVAISPDEALKVLIDPRKDRQHRAEGDLWYSAPDDLAAILCPIVAEGGAWRVMARCEPIRLGSTDRVFYERYAAMKHVIFGSLPKDRAGRLAQELSLENAGIWCGRVVMADYGGVEW